MHTARALLNVPSSRATPGFRDFAAQRGLSVENTATGTTIRIGVGTVTLAEADGRTALHIASPEAVNLQLVRDAVAARVADLGLTLDWQDKTAPGRPANLSLAQVTEVRRLTPSYTRVVMEGPQLARFATGPMHFRLLFGPDGADWPHTDAGGVTQWPGGAAAWHRPVYTTRSIDVAPDGVARIAFDVFLHAGGRVTEWTRTLTPGAEIAVTGPGGGRGPAPAGWHLLIGDETAVPVIARILTELPATTTGTALLFVPDAGDAQTLDHPPGVKVHWILRDGAQTPLSALRAQTLPDADRFVFFAAERQEALAARAHLLDLGLAKTEFQSASYWSAPED